MYMTFGPGCFPAVFPQAAVSPHTVPRAIVGTVAMDSISNLLSQVIFSIYLLIQPFCLLKP